MKISMIRIVTVSPLLLWPLVLCRSAQPADDKPLALVDITVIDATGGPSKPHMIVVVSAGRIADIQAYRQGHKQKTVEVIDGRGKFLVPGLWDMHVHWYDERFLPLFLANGVTGVRQMWGMDVHQQWRLSTENKSLLGPRQSIASPIIDGSKPVWPGSIAVRNAAEAEAAVRNSRGAGADFIKVYSLLSREAYFAIAAESKRESVPFAGHVPYAVSLAEASDAGQRSVEHLTGVLLAASSHENETRLGKNISKRCPAPIQLPRRVRSGVADRRNYASLTIPRRRLRSTGIWPGTAHGRLRH
jgi:hypothetical protein